jgi:hypothetical protein
MTQRLVELLQEFGGDLEELGITAVYLEATDGRPIPSLAVGAPPYEDGTPRSVTLAFIPDDGELEQLDMLQLFLPMPLTGKELGSPDAVAVGLMRANQTAVLGHAGITEEGDFYWRHIWPIPRGLPIIASVLFEMLSYFVFSAELGLESLRASH